MLKTKKLSVVLLALFLCFAFTGPAFANTTMDEGALTRDAALEILEKVYSEYGLEAPDNSKEVKTSDSKPIVDHTRTPAQFEKQVREHIEYAIKSNAEYEKKMAELGDVKWEPVPRLDEVDIFEPDAVVGIQATKGWSGYQNVYPNAIYTFAGEVSNAPGYWVFNSIYLYSYVTIPNVIDIFVHYNNGISYTTLDGGRTKAVNIHGYVYDTILETKVVEHAYRYFEFYAGS